MNTASCQLDPATLTRYLGLRDEAIAVTLAASERALPDVYARFGQKGREACAKDLGYHLDFLRPTLETHHRSPFIAHLGCLTHVLASRGVPLQSVQRSLDDLGSFFSARLGNAARPIVAALGAGKAALAQSIPAPTCDTPCPARHAKALPWASSALLGERAGAMALLEAALAREDSLAQEHLATVQSLLILDIDHFKRIRALTHACRALLLRLGAAAAQGAPRSPRAGVHDGYCTAARRPIAAAHRHP